jgi:hypothetical protein
MWDNGRVAPERPFHASSVHACPFRQLDGSDRPLHRAQYRNRKKPPPVRPGPVVSPVLTWVLDLAGESLDDLVALLSDQIGQDRRRNKRAAPKQAPRFLISPGSGWLASTGVDRASVRADATTEPISVPRHPPVDAVGSARKGLGQYGDGEAQGKEASERTCG